MNNGAGPIVTVFRSRLRSEAQLAYAEEAQQMEERARATEGLLEFKTFVGEDGERVSIIVFDTWENHRAWRVDRVHRLAQRHGREQFYAEYSIRVCEQMAHRVFPATAEADRAPTA
ncbi:MAG TPA: antibiotic biosynthesis monooxygenase [Acidimicrobiaceae bacterium]|nr:antibiotic biosynthesis monooxygenase [Acidimicrobiaceae bacterium]